MLSASLNKTFLSISVYVNGVHLCTKTLIVHLDLIVILRLNRDGKVYVDYVVCMFVYLCLFLVVFCWFLFGFVLLGFGGFFVLGVGGVGGALCVFRLVGWFSWGFFCCWVFLCCLFDFCLLLCGVCFTSLQYYA